MTEPTLHYQMIRVSPEVWTVRDTKGRIYAKEVPYSVAAAMMRFLYSLSGPVF